MNTDNRYVLIGLGAFGREIAMTLKDRGADLIVIDKDPVAVSQMKSEGFRYTVNIDNLDYAAVSKFVEPEDIVILSMGDNFEATILTIEILKEIGVEKIYARVTKDIQLKVLEKMDITEVVFPEKQEGRRFALKLLNWDINFIDEFSMDTFLIEVPVTRKLAGNTVLDLKLRSRYNVNIIALKSKPEEDVPGAAPKMDYVGFENTLLSEHHSFLVIGREKDLEEMLKDIE
jgi:trk system potassium uptake protein TrkA